MFARESKQLNNKPTKAPNVPGATGINPAPNDVAISFAIFIK